MLPIILASSSPYRRQLLAQLNLNFEAHSPQVDETPQPQESPDALAARLATLKAQVLAEQFRNHLIIGSDQVATLNGELLNKPGNHRQAVAQLTLCSDQQLSFYTGLCLLNSATGNAQIIVEPFTVKFRPLSAQQIEYYLRAEQPYDCAGSFKVEGLGISLFERLNGNDPNALIGLPLIQLTTLLANEGVTIPPPATPVIG